MKRFFLITVLFWIAVSPSYAQQENKVADWYAALRTADRDAISSVLTDDAKVLIKSLQVVQTKQEYIDALDTWEEIVDDLQLSYSADRVDAERIVAVVCYQFASNAFTNRETFTFEEGKIAQLFQEKIKDGC